MAGAEAAGFVVILIHQSGWPVRYLQAVVWLSDKSDVSPLSGTISLIIATLWSRVVKNEGPASSYTHVQQTDTL